MPLSDIVDIPSALEKVEAPTNLSPRAKGIAKEMVELWSHKLLSDPSIGAFNNTITFSDMLNNKGNGWAFDKVTSLSAALRQTTSDVAHKDVGTILLTHGRLQEHYDLFGANAVFSKCPITGVITQSNVKVYGMGLDLVLGFHNDPVGLAYKEFLFKLCEGMATELKQSAGYLNLERRVINESTAAFNDRKGKEKRIHGLSDGSAQALGMRFDKASHKAILNLPKGVSATKARREAGIMGNKTIAKSYNYNGALRALMLRNEIALATELAPNMDPDAVGIFVVDNVAPAYVMKNPQTGRPIGYKKQAMQMFSKKRAKVQLQRQNMLN